MNIPRTNPDGSVTLRSSPSGPIVTVAGVGQLSGANALVNEQFENDQALGVGPSAVVGATATFTDIPVGAYVVVQSVLNCGDPSGGAGLCNARVLLDGVSFWEPGPVQWSAVGEGSSFGKLPIQCQTAPVEEPTALLTVSLDAEGIGVIHSGHFQAELVLPP